MDDEEAKEEKNDSEEEEDNDEGAMYEPSSEEGDDDEDEEEMELSEDEAEFTLGDKVVGAFGSGKNFTWYDGKIISDKEKGAYCGVYDYDSYGII